MSMTIAEKVFGTPAIMGLSVLGLLALLLMVAAWSDLRTRRIPNWLVGAGLALALLAHLLLPSGRGFVSTLPGGLGILPALGGVLCALLVMLPLHVWLGMGAGDVKLTAMVGAFLGPQQVLPSILASLLAGGLLAAVVVIRRRLQRSRRSGRAALLLAPEGLLAAPAPRLPYALAIALGTLAYLGYQLRLAGPF